MRREQRSSRSRRSSRGGKFQTGGGVAPLNFEFTVQSITVWHTPLGDSSCKEWTRVADIPPRSRGRSPKHVPANPNPAHKEGPAPRTLQQLLEWQRSIAATIGKADSHQRFSRAVTRAFC
ncbi:g418 [Coccomyxa viridis]|uniref:G418 protein n=1 Tax=Coccomyxa viridis TaxID=1274662 RepID=A0ABP1FKZ6_9CHLO